MPNAIELASQCASNIDWSFISLLIDIWFAMSLHLLLSFLLFIFCIFYEDSFLFNRTFQNYECFKFFLRPIWNSLWCLGFTYASFFFFYWIILANNQQILFHSSLERLFLFIMCCFGRAPVDGTASRFTFSFTKYLIATCRNICNVKAT